MLEKYAAVEKYHIQQNRPIHHWSVHQAVAECLRAAVESYCVRREYSLNRRGDWVYITNLEKAYMLSELGRG